MKIIVSLIVVIIFWASAFVGIRAALQDLHPNNLALFRFLVASLLFLFIGKKIQRPAKTDLWKFVVLGILNVTLYNIFLNTGERSIQAAIAGFIVNAVPVFSTLLAFFVFKEKITLQQWLGITISFIGIYIMSAKALSKLNWSIDFIFLLLAAICQSASFVLLIKPLTKKYNPLTITSVSIWIGTLCLAFFQVDFFNDISSAAFSTVLSVIYLGVCPAALAAVCWAYVLSKIPISRVANFLFIVPIVALLIGFVWLKEIPAVLTVIGGLITLTGVFMSNFYRYKAEKPNYKV